MTGIQMKQDLGVRYSNLLHIQSKLARQETKKSQTLFLKLLTKGAFCRENLHVKKSIKEQVFNEQNCKAKEDFFWKKQK